MLRMTKTRLLSVVQLRAEVRAGLPGQCAVNVRVLDGVSIRIHAGELLLLQAPDALGPAMLLAALAGREHAPQHRYLRLERNVAPGVQIRRAALHPDVIPDIVHGWQEARAGEERPASRVLYLLRASRQRPPAGRAATMRELGEWRRWAGQARERRDGIVIASTSPPAPLSQRGQSPLAGRAHEPEATYHVRSTPPSSIRCLELRAGRLHIVRAPRRVTSMAVRLIADPAPPRWFADGSSDAHGPTASYPSTTRSTEP